MHLRLVFGRQGVDIEPDNQGASLQDIVFRRCVSIDNYGNGFEAALSQLDPDIDPPVQITFEDCHAVWSAGFSWEKDTSLEKPTSLASASAARKSAAQSP